MSYSLPHSWLVTVILSCRELYLAIFSDFGDGDTVYDDPVNCRGCMADFRRLFLGERRHNNLRYDMFFEEMERDVVTMEGDKKEKFRIAPAVNCPFKRGDYLPRGKAETTDAIITGFGKHHTCELNRIPGNVEVKPLLPAGSRWKGDKVNEIKMRVTVMGAVNQDAPGRWEWSGVLGFELEFPEALHPILGSTFVVDNWFRFYGEKASRKKKKEVDFDGDVTTDCPDTTKLDVEFEVFFVPAPCPGLILWGAYAEILEWKSHPK